MPPEINSAVNSRNESAKSPGSEKKSNKELAVAIRRERFRRLMENFGYAWTIFSAVYAIACTCALIGKKWVESSVTYALVGILAALVLVFAVVVGLTRTDRKTGRKHISLYNKLVKIFKASVTIVFLVLSAIAMAGVAQSEPGALGWLLFGFTFLVAVLQLALQIALVILNFYHKRVGRKYEVKVTKFVNGEPKESKTINKVYSKIYKNDGDKDDK